MCYSLKRGDLQRGVIHTTDYALEGGDGGGESSEANLQTKTICLQDQPRWIRHHYKWAF